MPNLSLSEVRQIARVEGLSEIYHNEQSRVVSFAGSSDENEGVRFNVYYTTGTVATCLDHPRQGKTQLFRRNIDRGTLRQIFCSPRAHTGVGYHRVRQDPIQSLPGPSPSKRQRRSFSVGDRAHVVGYADCTVRSGVHKSGTYSGRVKIEYDDGQIYHVPPSKLVPPTTSKRSRSDAHHGHVAMDEEAEAMNQMKNIESEEAFLKAEKEQVQAVLNKFAEDRRRMAEAKAEAERTRNAEEQRKATCAARGKFIDYSLYQKKFIDKRFNEKVISIACGRKSTIMLFEDGKWAFSTGLPHNLYNKLKGRSINDSPPVYVSIGSQNRYYIRFKDGSSQMAGCDKMLNQLKSWPSSGRTVKTVAFGTDCDSYCIVDTNGAYSFNNVPEKMDKLLRQRKKSDLDCVSLGPDGEYFVRAKNGKSWLGGMSSSNMDSITKIKDRVKFIDFGDDDTYIARYT